MTVLVVTQHYAPDETSTGAYLTAIAEGIAASVPVTVLAGTAGAAALAGIQTNPRVIELKNPAAPKSALARRAIAMVLFGARSFFQVLRHARRGMPVIVVTTPFTLPYFVALAARLRGAPSVVILYDLYPDVLIITGLVKESSFVTRALRFANRLTFRSVSAVVSIGRDMDGHLARYPDLAGGKVVTIPNWMTLEARLRPLEDSNPYRAAAKGKFVVGMFGTLGYTHDPATVFAAARLLKDDARIHFLLSGSGVGWAKLKEMQAAEPLPNVTLQERIPEEQIETFLSAANVWIIPYRKNMRGISVPSRFYNLLAVGRPIIALSEDDAEHARILSDDDFGWVVPPEDPQGLAQAIAKQAGNPADAAAKGARAAEAAASRYTLERSMEKYRELVLRLMRPA